MTLVLVLVIVVGFFARTVTADQQVDQELLPESVNEATYQVKGHYFTNQAGDVRSLLFTDNLPAGRSDWTYNVIDAQAGCDSLSYYDDEVAVAYSEGNRLYVGSQAGQINLSEQELCLKIKIEVEGQEISVYKRSQTKDLALGNIPIGLLVEKTSNQATKADDEELKRVFGGRSAAGYRGKHPTPDWSQDLRPGHCLY